MKRWHNLLLGLGMILSSSLHGQITYTFYDPFFNPSIPIESPLDLAISPQGEVWTNNFNSLVKFDGTNWTIYDSTDLGFSTRKISDLEFVGDNLWMATFGEGLIRIDPNLNILRFDMGNSLIPTDSVYEIRFFSNGDLLLKHEKGLSRFDQGTGWIDIDFTGILPWVSPLLEFDLAIDGMDQIWINVMGGMASYANGTWTRHTYQSLSTISTSAEFSAGPSGCFVNRFDGYYHYDYNTWTLLPNTSIYGGTGVNPYVDPLGNLWINQVIGGLPTLTEIHKFNGNDWINTNAGGVILEPEFLTNDMKLAPDSSLWIAMAAELIKIEGGIDTVYFNLPNTVDSFVLDQAYIWSVAHQDSADVDTRQYQVGGDTTLNGITYQKYLKRTGDSLALSNPTTPWQLIGLIREDSSRMYVRNFQEPSLTTASTTDVLYYDYGLAVGDTFELLSCLPPVKSVVEVHDTVFFAGKDRARIIFEDSAAVWLQGIGDLEGPIHMFTDSCSDLIESTLLCVDSPFGQVYQDSSLFTCFLEALPDSSNPNLPRYAPLLTDSTRWSVASTAGFGGGTSTNFYYVDGQTIIDSLAYYNLYAVSTLDSNFEDTSFSFAQQFGLIREEEGKVYVRNITSTLVTVPPSAGEKLYYDFTLEVGDTLTPIGSRFTYSVTETDSISINGIMRKRIKFDQGIETWVEGLGSLQGVVHSFGNELITDTHLELLCVREGQEYLYQRYPGICYLLLASNRPTDPSFVNIFPNPTEGQLSLEFSEDWLQATFSIYDLQSKLIFSNKVSHTNLILDQELPDHPGLYLIHVQSGSRSLSKKLIVK
ncbi:MAG: T9SS type A sorting domain-containing protein [Bacteroidota bacterium]